MASVTAGVSATSTTDNAALTTGSFTPAAGDLLVVFVVVTGRTGGVVTDSQGLSWVQETSALKNGSADVLLCFVAESFTANSSMTVTFTPDGTICTGIAISVLRVSGMSNAGAAAVVQSAVQQNQAAGTPAPAFGVAATTTNPCVGAVATTASPDLITEPAGWTERHEVGYATPNTTLESVSRDSGFTGTTVTWGGMTMGTFGSIVVELDASAAAVTFFGVNVGQARRPWVLARSRFTAPLEPTMFVEPTQAWSVQGRGVPPPPRRAPGAKLFAPEIRALDALPELGWSMRLAGRGRFAERHTNKSRIVHTWEPGAIGFESWAVVAKRGRVETWRPNRSFFALPTQREPEFPDSWLGGVAGKAGRYAALRPSRSSFSFLAVPYENDPVVTFFNDRRAVQPPPYPNRSRVSSISIAAELPFDRPLPVVRAGAVHPPMRANSTRIAYRNIHDEGTERLAFGVMTTRPVLPVVGRSSQVFTRPLEPTGTGVTTIPLPPLLTRPALRRVYPWQRCVVFETLLAISTVVRIDDRDSGGVTTRTQTGRAASSSGRSSRARSSTGVGTGRPPNP